MQPVDGPEGPEYAAYM